MQVKSIELYSKMGYFCNVLVPEPFWDLSVGLTYTIQEEDNSMRVTIDYDEENNTFLVQCKGDFCMAEFSAETHTLENIQKWVRDSPKYELVL